MFVFNKPAGLAVQGGSGVTRNVDQMLEAWTSKKGEKPRLVHRLDRDTSGVLVVARTRLAAMKLAEAFRARETKKTYWALVKGVPRKREDKISTWLVKEATPDGDRMRVANHGENGADHAVSYYRVIEQAGRRSLGWKWSPTRAAPTSCVSTPPISAIQSSATRNISTPTPTGIFRAASRTGCICMRDASSSRTRTAALIDVTAPLPPHMRQSWNLLGFDEANAEECGRRDGRSIGCGRRLPPRHGWAHLLVGTERRRGEAFKSGLQSDLRFSCSCRDRQRACVPVVQMARHCIVRARRNAAWRHRCRDAFRR